MRASKLFVSAVAVLVVFGFVSGNAYSAAKTVSDPKTAKSAAEIAAIDAIEKDLKLKLTGGVAEKFEKPASVSYRFKLNNGFVVDVGVNTATGAVSEIKRSGNVKQVEKDIKYETFVLYSAGVVVERRNETSVYGINQKLDEYTLDAKKFNVNGTAKDSTYIHNVYGTNSKLLNSVNDRVVYTYTNGAFAYSTRDRITDTFHTNGQLQDRVRLYYKFDGKNVTNIQYETYSFTESGMQVTNRKEELALTFYSTGKVKTSTGKVTNYVTGSLMKDQVAETHTYTYDASGNVTKDTRVNTAAVYGDANKKLFGVTTTSDVNGAGKLLTKKSDVVVDQNGTSATFKVYYTVNSSGNITSTRVVDPAGKDVTSLCGNNYVSPETVLNKIVTGEVGQVSQVNNNNTTVTGDPEVLARMSVIEKAGSNVGSELFSNEMATQKNEITALAGGIANPANVKK